MASPITSHTPLKPSSSTAGILLAKLKSNKAFTYSFANRVITAGTAFVTILFVTTWFTPELQGYYYMFNNLLLLNFLLDVGFGIVMVQFASHEWARLHFDEQQQISGDNNAKARLASLVRLSIKWYAGVALLFFVAIGVGGYFFIGLQGKPFVQYTLPWILLVTAVSCSISLSPFKSLLEGTNQIAKNQFILLMASVAGALFMWAAIYTGMGLYAISINLFAGVAVTIALLRKPALQFLKLRHTKGVNDKTFWKNEFWGQQWKIGISWLLGYFMLQSFVPLAFKLLNPLEAGKIGATMQLFNLVNMIGMIWVTIAGPRFGMLGAGQDYTGVRVLVTATLKKSILFSLLAFVGIVLALYLARVLHLRQAARFADMPTVLLLLFTGIAAQCSNVFTTAVRFQKKEPFLLPTIVCTVLEMALIFCTVQWLGAYAFGIVFFVVIALVLVPWTYLIYKKEFKTTKAVKL